MAFGTPDGNALILPKLDGYPTMLVGACLLTLLFFFFFFFLREGESFNLRARGGMSLHVGLSTLCEYYSY